MGMFDGGSLKKQQKEQQRMFAQEMQYGREQSAFDSADRGDEVYFAQKERLDDLTRWQQDLEKDMKTTIHDIKREVQNEQGEWEPELEYVGKDEEGMKHYRKAKPLMNQRGLDMFKATMRPLTSRNLMMSNYTEDRIYTKLRAVVNNFIIHLAYYNEDYEIDKGNLPILVRMFKDLAEPAHWRCLNNGERSYLNTINKRVEAIALGDKQEPKKSWFGI